MLGAIGNLMAQVRPHIRGVRQAGDPEPVVDTGIFPTLPSLMPVAMKEQSASQVEAVNMSAPLIVDPERDTDIPVGGGDAPVISQFSESDPFNFKLDQEA
ncbi:hypothetical protein L3X38_026746 [Prunus dulcis]|uniref:Uncharacterized protein n=1 Tax=Prunus dulcis TaxID=3755 RepID=A0AAD4VLM6_PRUDU|nr:hypothetical protein L3X38_026746 [Prunus dulcis]